MERLLLQNYKAYLDRFQMTPDEFLALYPDMSREQLAQVAGCSVSTVNHWFDNSEAEPTDYHKLRMSLAHWYFTQKSARPPLFEELDGLDESGN